MTTSKDFKYTHLGETQRFANEFFAERIAFWEAFNNKYDFDLIRGEYKISKKVKNEL